MLPSETASASNGGQQGPQPANKAAQPQISILGNQSHDTAGDSGFTMELLELELSVDGFSEGRDGFTAHVAEAATTIGGTLLFELPASGLFADCERVAVLRVPRDDIAGEAMTVFACLETGGSTIRMENPSEATADLKNFADAFVDVLRRI